jgi:ABC-type antimicrobial peptide transport system permease subunit
LTLGAGIAVGLVWLLGLALPLAIPNATLVLTGQAVLRVGLAALLIGVIAALAPAWQMARLDPARVFRG